MKITALGRTLSLLEGPTEKALTRAKAWDMKGGIDLTQDPNRIFRRMRGFRNIYLQGGYVAEGIDLFPIYAIGAGYEIEIDEKIAEKLGIDGKAEQQTVKEFFETVNFFDVQWQLSVDAEVVRDGVAEIVYGRGQAAGIPVNVIPRPGECFEFRTNLTGSIESYEQAYDNRGNSITPVKLEPSQVLHYQYLSRPDSPYGISLIERTVHDINRDTKVAEAITAGICLHGTPKWHVKANSTKTDAVPLTDTEFSDLEKQFEKFNAKDQFITEGDIVVTALDTAGVQNVQQYSDVTLIRVAAGMGFPAELLGVRQGTTDATAVSRIGAFLKKIKIVQRDIESLWNLGVIDKVTGKPGLIKLKLNPASPEDFVQQATAIAALRSGQYPEKVMPWQHARTLLKIPTNQDLGIEETEPRPNPAQGGLNEWASLKGRVDQTPGGKIEEEEAEDAQEATKELAAAAHELSQIVRGATRELFNENHDPENGQFSEGGGSGSGGGSSGGGSTGGEVGKGDAGGSSSKGDNGGSTHEKEINDFRSKYQDSEIEHSVIYKDGKIIAVSHGDEHSVQIPEGDFKDADFVHNHPHGNPALSPSDISLAMTSDAHSISAVTKNGGTWTITKPETGWGASGPFTTKANVERIFWNAGVDVRSDRVFMGSMVSELRNGRFTANEENQKLLTKISQKAIKDLGFKLEIS
jgi:hypothetical protein